MPPAVVYGKDGRPLYSWRVLVLPYIEYQELYDSFKLDEPWDSPNNLPLLEQMPKIFESHGKPAPEPYTTYYQVFVGPGAAFEGKDGLPLADFTDGTSNTLFIVEAAEAVPWSKPADLAFAPDRPLPELGGLFADGFNAAFADGSVHFFPKEVSEDKLRALITRNGGERVYPDDP
jgi:hypothetical protein